MRKILMAGVVASLLVTGCADKKLTATTPVAGSGVAGGGVIASTNPIVYENVDPVGQGMGQGNGSYGMNGNGAYGDGSYGNGSGVYSDESGQYGASSGVQNIYFGVDQYSITSDKLGQISHNAKLLRNSNKVKIEGHCDASGSDEYNYALGLKRAKATKDALVLNGIPANKIMLVSMGESSPECTSSTSADCYAKNRRVEFKIMR